MISAGALDNTMNTTTSPYDKARALFNEIHRNLKASKDQRKYLLKIISILSEIESPVLLELAKEIESKL